jgi:hypothetical protein
MRLVPKRLIHQLADAFSDTKDVTIYPAPLPACLFDVADQLSCSTRHENPKSLLDVTKGTLTLYMSLLKGLLSGGTFGCSDSGAG